ncbi:hypothetical protein P3X46_015087 [Hevea brasiliensis]|uniref:PRA1 family protein n=1 Tax=Hevea brasiliensis TaxID=3981 RepID=A0ABQ9LUS9_HEVBR|nr:PRA1 family protein F3 [Hevea brasiliensis]KAJ9171769.1 hypothetical protein P3X46_015087 [Hevea brasiliensis]
MATYGTIPTELHPPSNLRIISNAKEKIELSLGTRRPWREMIQLQSFNLPFTLSESVQKIKTNVAFFRYNYVIIILFILFLSLLWHPVSLIVFIIMMAAWLFLYFLRDDPLVVLGIVISDKVVMVILLMATIIMLSLTNVTDNIIVALFLGVVVILVHGAFRNIDDLMFVEDEEGFGSAGILSGRDNAATVPLKNAASPSFSAS